MLKYASVLPRSRSNSIAQKAPKTSLEITTVNFRRVFRTLSNIQEWAFYENRNFMKTDFFAKSSLLDIWLSSEYNSLGCVRKLYPEIFVILGAGTGQWRTERWINLDKNLRAFQTSKSIAYYVISSKCKLHCCLWSVVFLKKYSMQIWFENYLKKKLGYCFSLRLSRVKNHTLNSMFDTTLY